VTGGAHASPAVNAPYDLLVVGRPSVDVLFAGLPRWPALGDDVAAPGLGLCAGTAFNTPAAANRLGLRVAFVATLGNDPISRMIGEEFDTEGIPRTFVHVRDEPLPCISVALNMDGDRGFVTYWGGKETYDAELDARALDVAATIDARHVHLYLDSQPALEARCKQRGMTVSLDTYEGGWWKPSRSLEDIVANADIVFTNEREAEALAGEEGLAPALDRLAAHCPCVVVKRGAKGAIAIQDGVVEEVPAAHVRVVDTTGAGDCFNAGFLVGWLDGLSLRDSLTLGVLAGTAAVTDYGGYRGCPRAEAFRALAGEHAIALGGGATA
jgi:sugar/nucleoside kinase (ribokinase family)